MRREDVWLFAQQEITNASIMGVSRSRFTSRSHMVGA